MEIKSPILLFQPTLPQGERLSTTYPTDVYLDISTHAPARGATFHRQEVLSEYLNISTHAPARGATLFPGRIPRGEESISTHAPARGATSRPLPGKAGEKEFQPTLPQGERHVELHDILNVLCISTHAPARGATGHSGKVRGGN